MVSGNIGFCQKDIKMSFISTPKFNKEESFWCSECDEVLVSSEKPETGKFFALNGHVWDKGEVLGEWPRVCFALCPDCLKQLKGEL